MQTVFEAIRKIAFEIDHAIKTSDLGYAEGENASGEEQLKIDVLSDLIVETEFATVPEVNTLVSEEKEGKLKLHSSGKYMVCYDPLDGSSLIDVNLSVGSIFGIYEGGFDAENLVAAAYVVYGPRIELVIATKENKPMLYRATGDQFKEIGEISLDEKGKLNAPGGTQQNWPSYHKTFIDSLFAEGYRLRYSGGMVPDLHQLLLKGGGLFSYPGTSDKPCGKLRQLFEVIPFAFMYEQAGGQAINEKGERLMELVPEHHHDTSPCFFGSNYEIEALKKSLRDQLMHEAVLNEWQITLEQKKNALEACQKEKDVQSCSKCDQLLHCELREAYVKAVYESMSKGETGGFEF